jgi:RNA polymerase sigma-70 factor (ECF subfamily)
MSSDEAQPEWIAKAVAGDRLALEKLLLAHSLQLSLHIGAKLPGSVKGVLGVEDILQQTFVHAFQRIERLEHTTQRSFSAWLKAIAENQVQDAVRGLRRKKRGGAHRQLSRPAQGQQSSIADLVELLSDRQHTPSRSVARREAVQAVQVGIAALPEDQREAVRQHLLEGKSLAETASAMGRTPGAVSALVHRAKRNLREALGRASLWLSGG